MKSLLRATVSSVYSDWAVILIAYGVLSNGGNFADGAFGSWKLERVFPL